MLQRLPCLLWGDASAFARAIARQKQSQRLTAKGGPPRLRQRVATVAWLQAHGTMSDRPGSAPRTYVAHSRHALKLAPQRALRR